MYNISNLIDWLAGVKQQILARQLSGLKQYGHDKFFLGR